MRPALKIGIASRPATLVKRAAPRPMPFSSTFWRPNDAPRNRRGNHSAAACWRRALAASSCAISASTSGRRCSSAAGCPGLMSGHGHVAAPGLDARAMEGLVADQHGDAVPRDRRNRLQRRDLRACRFGIGLRALDVEGRRQACPMARLHQAQGLVMGGGDRAQRVELAQRADQREVVGGDIGHHQQAHAAHAVLRGQRVGGRCGRARAQAAAQVDLPRDVEAGAAVAGVRHQLLHRVAVAAAAVAGRADRADAGRQEGTAHRHAGSRRAQALGGDLDVAVLLRREVHQVGQDRVAEAFPPGGLGLHLGGRARGERRRHVHRGLQHRRGTAGEDQGDRCGQRGRYDEAGQALGVLVGRLPDVAGQRRGGWKSRHRMDLVWIRGGVSVGPGACRVVSVGSPFGRHFERSLIVRAASFASGVRRALAARRREVGRDRRQQLFGGRKLVLASGDQVLDAAREGPRRGVAAQLHTYARRFGYLDSGFRTIADQGMQEDSATA